MPEVGILGIVAAVAVIFGVIWTLTSTPDRRLSQGSEPTEADAVHVLLPVVRDAAETSALYASRSRELGEILHELLSRMGMAPDEAAVLLRNEGFDVSVAPQSDTRHGFGVVSAGKEQREAALERALVVGISLARRDDDHAGVGDDALDLEALAREADETEHALFGEGRRERHAFYARATMALQDMLQSAQDGPRRRTLAGMLERFDEAVHRIQADMARVMARLPDNVERLAWGDAADRRMYYFKMGVTNSLRRSGALDSLGHLYRYQGVDYDVVEAYDLASRECPLLTRAEALDIDRLLTMGPAEVHGLVQGAITS